jgi:two-component system response regulator HydG
MARKAEILLVDDEEALRIAAEKILQREGYRVTSCPNAKEGLAQFGVEGVDLLITDLMLPDLDGIEVLKRAKESRPTVEVIVITGHGTVEKAVEAMRLGAYDFIEKPLDPPLLLKAVAKAIDRHRLAAENRQLREQLQKQAGEEALVGNCAAMVSVKKLIRQIAATDISVLIRGESGTGKEIVADVIHQLSSRKDGPIVKISCAAIPENLLESELFGYERGAFTGAVNSKPGKFELAHGGTLLLDEIAEMSPQLQAKLLRVLQDGRFQRVGGTKDIQVDVRVLSATHVDISKAIKDGKFREDLLYRLNVMSITLPSLRQRREDIPLLAIHFLNKHAPRMQKEVHTIAPPAMEELLAHPWPGNVRELENVMQRALAMVNGDTIVAFQMAPVTDAESIPTTPIGPAITIPLGTPLSEIEDRVIEETLKHCGGVKEKAAKMLGVSSRTLQRRSSEKPSEEQT